MQLVAKFKEIVDVNSPNMTISSLIVIYIKKIRKIAKFYN